MTDNEALVAVLFALACYALLAWFEHRECVRRRREFEATLDEQRRLLHDLMHDDQRRDQ